MTSSISEFDESLGQSSVNMNNVLEAIINCKKDIQKYKQKHMEQLQFLKSAIDSNNLEEINNFNSLLIKLASDKYNKEVAKIPKTIDQDLRNIYMYTLKKQFKIDSQSIMKDFKDFGYIKKFHKDEMLQLKEFNESKINNIIYMYITNYIYYEPEYLTDSELFTKINEYLHSKVLETKIKLKLESETDKTIKISNIEILQSLNKHIKYIFFTFYKIHEIGINEIDILPTGEKCLNDMCKISSECLVKKDTILFIGINTPNKDDKIVYNALCVTRQDFLRFITDETNKKYPCSYNDPVTYISVPLGLNRAPIFISYLSAVMIYKQNNKSIFYLLHQEDNEAYCDTTPIMYAAICSGDNCRK